MQTETPDLLCLNQGPVTECELTDRTTVNHVLPDLAALRASDIPEDAAALPF